MEFKENGSLVYNDDLTFHYREFCVALNQQSMVRQHGRYMVQLCLPREQAAAGEKYSFYYIILSISIVCLILTITIYVVFRKALLRLDYNHQRQLSIAVVLGCFIQLSIVTENATISY